MVAVVARTTTKAATTTTTTLQTSPNCLQTDGTHPEARPEATSSYKTVF